MNKAETRFRPGQVFIHRINSKENAKKHELFNYYWLFFVVSVHMKKNILGHDEVLVTGLKVHCGPEHAATLETKTIENISEDVFFSNVSWVQVA